MSDARHSENQLIALSPAIFKMVVSDKVSCCWYNALLRLSTCLGVPSCAAHRIALCGSTHAVVVERGIPLKVY